MSLNLRMTDACSKASQCQLHFKVHWNHDHRTHDAIDAKGACEFRCQMKDLNLHSQKTHVNAIQLDYTETVVSARLIAASIVTGVASSD